jgi:hypothetical protein
VAPTLRWRHQYISARTWARFAKQPAASAFGSVFQDTLQDIRPTTPGSLIMRPAHGTLLAKVLAARPAWAANLELFHKELESHRWNLMHAHFEQCATHRLEGVASRLLPDVLPPKNIPAIPASFVQVSKRPHPILSLRPPSISRPMIKLLARWRLGVLLGEPQQCQKCRVLGALTTRQHVVECVLSDPMHDFLLPFGDLVLFTRTAEYCALGPSSTALDQFLDCLPRCAPGRPVDEAAVPLWQKACSFLRAIWSSCLGNSLNTPGVCSDDDWIVRVVRRPPAF